MGFGRVFNVKRRLASIVLVLFLNQFAFVSFGHAMSQVPDDYVVDVDYDFSYSFEDGSDIQKLISTRADFVRGKADDHLYVAADYIDDRYLDNYSSFDDFKNALKGSAVAGEAIYIPISVSGVTIVVPFYPELASKSVGDAYVVTRLVAMQIADKLGRKLINMPGNERYSNEYVQYERMLANAVALAKNNKSLEFGERYPNPEGVPLDIIWPEKRVINGQEVLVPVVYLPRSTVAHFAVKGNIVELPEGGKLEGLDGDGVDISVGAGAKLTVMRNLILRNGGISSSGDMELLVGGTLNLLSSRLETGGDIRIGAGGINAQTLVHRYDFGNQTGTRYGEITSINADGDVKVHSYGDMNFVGVDIDAGKGITFQANGNVHIGSVMLQEYYDGREGRWRNVNRSEIDYLISELSAEETISLIAGGQITIDSANIVSDRGQIELLAGMGISIVDNVAEYQVQRKGKFGKKKVNESVYQTVAIRSVLDAGKGVVLHSEYGDITLRATDITAKDGTQIKATNGGVNLLMTTETDHYSYSSVRKGMFTVSTKQKGHNIETGVMNAFVGGMAVEALNGVQVEYVGDPDLTPEEQIEVLSQMEGMEWLADIHSNPDVQAEFEQIMLEHKTWYESNKSLSPAAMAVITIAVAIATSGTGTAIASSVTSATSAAGATLSASLGAASAAAFTSLATTAITSLAAGNSVASTLDTLSSDENLKSVAVSMVTAGAISAIDAEFFAGTTDGFDAAALTDGSQAAVDAATSSQAAQQVSSIGSQVAQAAAHASIQAGVSVVANGGSISDFKDQFVQAMAHSAISKIGEELAKEIGAAKDSGNINTALQYVAHAGVGCLTGTATTLLSDGETSLGCTSGAGGAIVGEAIGQLYQSTLEEDLNQWLEEEIAKGENISRADITKKAYEFKQRGVDLARLGAAMTAFTLGGDVDIAAATGANAAENNALFTITALLVAAAYTSYVSYLEGGFYEALQSIGRGEDPVAQAMQSITTEAAELLIQEYPDKAREVFALLEASGAVISDGVQIILETEVGGKVVFYWNELDSDLKAAIVGGVTVGTFVIPAGVIDKLKILRNIDVPFDELVNDPNHENWDFIPDNDKEILLNPISIADRLTPVNDLPLLPVRAIPSWHGSGPEPGVLGLNSSSASNSAIANFLTPSTGEGVEYIFDLTTSTFLLRGNRALHQHAALAASIGMPKKDNMVVAGILKKSRNGVIYTNENSGHYHMNWTDDRRKIFVDTMKKYGFIVEHSEGME